MITTDPLRRAAGALLGPCIWAAHFLTIYVSEVLACRQAAPRLHDLVVAVMTVAAVLAVVGHRVGASRCLRRVEAGDARRFLWGAGAALDGLSVIGIGCAALVALLVGACR